MEANGKTAWVVEQARALGLDLCGVARVEPFEELAQLHEWLARGYAGEMSYLRDPRRISPEKLFEGARSLIVCALNYNTPLPYSTEVPRGANGHTENPAAGPRGWISRYAWGHDYHEVLSEKLEALILRLREHFAEPLAARAYVDTGPVLERVAAKYAGLGWLAKNTCLINSEMGSWLFLGVIVTTLELVPSLESAAPAPDLCGNCRLCIDACPTGAIVEPYVLDARRCISYLTIELRGSIPEDLRKPMGRHVFGCDICQDVCPWNRQAPATKAAAFLPREIVSPEQDHGAVSEVPEGNAPPFSLDTPLSRFMENSLFAPDLEWLASLTEEDFRAIFRHSAIKRTKWRGLVRNACVALGNSGLQPGRAEKRSGKQSAYERVIALLDRLAAGSDEVIADHARWALGRLRGNAAKATGTGE